MSSYWRGLRDGVPFLAVIGPFGMLFGVLGTEAGLAIHETMAFSIVVIAGAAQFTALQLLSENAPTLVVIASALAVNLRMAMYSASITPHLGSLPLWKRGIAAYFLVDQTYAASVADFEKNPNQTPAQKFGYFLGVMTPICPPWYLATLAGALLGERIPSSLGLDFALPCDQRVVCGGAVHFDLVDDLRQVDIGERIVEQVRSDVAYSLAGGGVLDGLVDRDNAGAAGQWL